MFAGVLGTPLLRLHFVLEIITDFTVKMDKNNNINDDFVNLKKIDKFVNLNL